MRIHRGLLSLASIALFVGTASLSGCQRAAVEMRGDGSTSFKVSMSSVAEARFANTHQFYYYPSTQVYRDCDEDRWMWTEDGGLTWRSGADLPAGVDVGEEIPFAIFLASNTPEMEHMHIAAAYPAEDAPATVTVQGHSDFE